MVNWHRLFGLFLTDFFTDSPFSVELEKDLSVRQQFLDVVVVRRRKGRFAGELPDGLDDLAAHNLITFKSHRDTLDDWALKELTGHYVNYRKQLAPAKEELLPEGEFRLYAVCCRYPHNLAGAVPWEPVREGVYDCRRGTDTIRVIVAGQLPQEGRNALLHLFSASAERVRFGAAKYQQRSEGTSSLMQKLLLGYKGEGVPMPYTMDDFRQEFKAEFLKELTPEERTKGLTPEERVKGLSVDELLKGLSPEQARQLLQRLQAELPEPPKK